MPDRLVTAPQIATGIASSVAALLAVEHVVGYTSAALAIAGLLVALHYRTRAVRSAERARLAADHALDRFFRRSPAPMVRVAYPLGDDGHPDRTRVAEGRFSAVNASACAALGYVEEALTAKPFAAFIAPEDEGRTLDEVPAAIAHGDDLDGFTNPYVAGPLHARPGSVVWLRWSGTPDPETDLASFAVVTAEVAERAKTSAAEAAARRARDRADLLEEQADTQRKANRAQRRLGLLPATTPDPAADPTTEP